MKRKWIVIILICAVFLVTILIGISLHQDEKPWKENTAQEPGVEVTGSLFQ